MGPFESLNAYLQEVRDRAFAWGSHDCFTFTNEGWRRMYGAGWADDWLGRYMRDDHPIRKAELVREYGFQNFLDAVDTRLRRIGHVPPRGALVATRKGSKNWYIGHALGFCLGHRTVFLGADGLVFSDLDQIEFAWGPA